MDQEQLRQIAYAMQAAYFFTDNMGDAVHEVAAKFPDVKEPLLLRGMWLAIDAHVDLND